MKSDRSAAINRRNSSLLAAASALREKIQAHLDDSQISYEDHLQFALRASVRLAHASVASLVHAFVPALFPATSARIVIELYKERLEFHPNPRYQDMMRAKTHPVDAVPSQHEQSAAKVA